MAKVDTESEEYALGRRIHNFRKARGLTQQQLADKLEVDRTAVSAYENGCKGEMGYKTLQKFASALDMTSSQLLGEPDFLDGLSSKDRETVVDIVDALKIRQKEAEERAMEKTNQIRDLKA